uniref:Flap structure-specific endonuclease 1 n=1 Tax=Hucho hucho TaxID=62062 RepID=A0A4W5NFQ1_9TELE
SIFIISNCHLMSTFYQTIHMLGHGIKPVYEFDGKPPQLKSQEVRTGRAEAEKLLAQVQETGAQENIDKFSKHLVKVTRQHNDECKKLLTIMGAPCEAEASCTALVKVGKVVATVTEDMDSLTFGKGVLLRHLTTSDAKYYCIHLCCDLFVLGPLQKHPAPEDWLYKEARGLFLQPDIVDCSTVDLKWSEPDEDALIQFMCAEKQFSKKMKPEIKGSANKKWKTGATPGK